MKRNRIKNLPEPAAWDDPVTRSFLSKQILSILNQIKPISVHAEEQGSLENGNYEFSFGNGSSGRAHGLGGYCMATPGRIIKGSLMVVKGNRFLEEEVKINIVVNGVEKIDYSLIKKKRRRLQLRSFSLTSKTKRMRCHKLYNKVRQS